MVGIFIRNTLIYKLQWKAVDIFSGLKFVSINPVYLPVYWVFFDVFQRT